MDATRTQIEAAHARFHYSRGYNDAVAQMKQGLVVNVALEGSLLFSAFVLGWLLGWLLKKN